MKTRVWITVGGIILLIAMAAAYFALKSAYQPVSSEQDASIPAKSQNNQKQKAGKNDDPSQTAMANLIPTNPAFLAPEIVASPTDKSITVNVVPAKKLELYIEYGKESGIYQSKTPAITVEASISKEIVIDQLEANTRYYYRLQYREIGAGAFTNGKENSFMTQRTPGRAFTFALQGDSHPERPQMFDPALYLQTMKNVQADKPDFYITIGDDFSIEKVNPLAKEGVEKLYLLQRQYLGQIGSSAPLFLVNGNHEHAARYMLNGTANNPAVWGQNARNMYFSQPAPNSFYTGDMEQVPFIGYLRDYYAWTWGDALFVTIDPYWHSSVAVDGELGGGDKKPEPWETTLGPQQYQWFKKTLEESKAKYKFVFTHHVQGSGRGGTDLADFYEWGGKSKNGVWEFDKKRPGWELPIHQLMVKNGVTIYFQGHDHIFVKQERDGVIYQTLPLPADPNYALYNADAYKTGVKYPGSGHVRVSVEANKAKVEYVASYLPKDVTSGKKNGDVIYSYTVTPK